MKFVLYLVIILAASAIAKYLFGTRREAKTVFDEGVQRLAVPDLAKFKTWLIDMACKQCGEGVRSDPLATTRLDETAEKALAEIKEGGKAEINLPYLTADQTGPKHFIISIDSNLLQQI